MKRIATLHGTGLPLREPDAQCEACGARRHERGDGPPTPEDLARFAADLVEFANEVEEPMPLMIEAFIHRYGARPHQ